MDDLVLRGMAKWPDVPAVYGWLALNRRGQWLIKGELVSNPVIADFIGRNYEHDEDGRWFFQNGPQRVFVDLEYTPYVFRAPNASGTPLTLVSHTGARAPALLGAWIDDEGAILLETESGVGIVHDKDLDAIVAALVDETGSSVPETVLDELMARIERGEDAPLRLQYADAQVPVGRVDAEDVPQRFGFDPNPTAPAGHLPCE
jgi:hypothetical protein